MKIPRDNNLSGRFFVAAAFTRKVEDSISVTSGWKIWKGSENVPQTFTTIKDTLQEPFFGTIRKISKDDPKLAVLDVSFSIPVNRLDSTHPNVWVGSGAPRLDIELKTALNFSDIKDAVTNMPHKADHIVFRKTEGSSYLYNVYMLLKDLEKDSIRLELSMGNGEADTTKKFLRRVEDLPYMDFHNTFYTLLRIPASVTDPINFEGTLATLDDSLSQKLLITAILDRSLPHASPPADSLDAASGIFTNYIQFMDNAVRNWSGIGDSEPGWARLGRVHGKILEWNEGELRDPVIVECKGTVSDYGLPENKRKNYAFYEGYTRLMMDLERPAYTGTEHIGAGVMFRISSNIELYQANLADTFNMFGEPLLSGGEQSRRLIVSAGDSLFVQLDKDGLWVKGIDISLGEQKYYTGLEAVRLPLKKLQPITLGVPFFITSEKRGRGDPEGVLVGGPEKSVLRVHHFTREKNGGLDTLRNTLGTEIFLH